MNVKATENAAFNPWPWGIVAVFVVFISATVGLVVFTTHHRMDLVSRDYYDEEIRYQRQVERLERSRTLTAEAGVQWVERDAAIVVRLPVSHVRAGVSGKVHLYRPSAAGLDQVIELAPDAGGLQAIRGQSLRPGWWKVRVLWNHAGEEYFVEGGALIPEV